MTTPAHRPAGTPDGGQLTRPSHTEPAVQLGRFGSVDPGVVIAYLNAAQQRETAARRRKQEPVPTSATAMIAFLNRRQQERGTRPTRDLAA